jgi:tetratricopeptide (TPR) repeat protein
MNKRNALILLLLMVSIFLGYAENLNAAESFLDKGISEFKAENYEEALQFLIKAREQQPESSTAAYYLGMTYNQMGEYRQASKHLRDAIRLTPSVKEAYPELIQALINLNELKEAKDWIAQAEQKDVKPGQITYLKGLILLKEGKNSEAIDAFKKAKRMDSSLNQASDMQIAVALTKQRRFAEAKETLRAIISVDPLSEIGTYAREYEIAFDQGLKKYKSWWASAGIAYQYDDNVLLKPSRSIPDVLIRGQRDSSVITTLGFRYNPRLSEPWFFNAQYNFYADTHFSKHKVDFLYQTVSLTPGYQFPKGAITLPVAYSHVWLDRDQYMAVALANPTVSFMFLPNHIGQFSMGYMRREILHDPPDRYENRDGNILTVSPGYIYSFKNGKGLFMLKYEFSSDNTEGKNWENTGNQIILNFLLPLMDKLSLTISGEMFLQDYQHTHTFFGMKRSDRTYYGAAGMRWEVLNGLNLNLQYSHTHADSNISVYEYKRNIYTVGLEYIF